MSDALAAWPLSLKPLLASSLGDGLAYNTLVVLVGVAAVGFAAGVAGSLALLRKRPLVGDAAAHATLLGVALAFLATGRRDLPTLLAGGLVSAVAALLVLVLLRRVTRTREDAATAIVIGVSFGAGVALLAGMTSRGLPGSAGLEQFLLGHTAALTSQDAALLVAASLLAVAVVVASLKETVLVAFDAAFAKATGWPVGLIDAALVTIVAVMVVVGLPAAGAVLVTALVVIPPVAARQWTDRVGTMLLVAGLVGLVAAVAGVALSTQRPGLATGPLVVLAAAAICGVSFFLAPERGWIVRRLREASRVRRWTRGRLLEECLRRAGREGGGAFDASDVLDATCGDAATVRRAVQHAWKSLVLDRSLELAAAAADLSTDRRRMARKDRRGTERACVVPEGELRQPGRDRWQLSAAGLAEASERRRRIEAWGAVLDTAVETGREAITLELPPPEEVLDQSVLKAAGLDAKTLHGPPSQPAVVVAPAASKGSRSPPPPQPQRES